MFSPWIFPFLQYAKITWTYWKSTPGIAVVRKAQALDFLIFHQTSSPLIRCCWVSREGEGSGEERASGRHTGEITGDWEGIKGLGGGVLQVPLCEMEFQGDWYLASKKWSMEVAIKADGCVVH